MDSFNKNNAPNIFQQYIDYQDTDAGGVVYHSNYINFAERARGKIFRELFTEQILSNYLWVVKSLNVNFLSPARLGDFITLKTSVAEIKNCSITFSQNIFVKDKLMVTMLIQIVSLNQDFKVTKFANEIKTKLIKYQVGENY